MSDEPALQVLLLASVKNEKQTDRGRSGLKHAPSNTGVSEFTNKWNSTTFDF